MKKDNLTNRFDKTLMVRKEQSQTEKNYGFLQHKTIALSDDIMELGLISSAGSRMLSSYVAVFEGQWLQKLRKEGASFLPHLKMKEFSVAQTGDDSAVVNKQHLPAYVVKESLADVAISGDETGLIKHSAAQFGLIAFRPGLNPQFKEGLINFSSSFYMPTFTAKHLEDLESIYSLYDTKVEKETLRFAYDHENFTDWDASEEFVAIAKEHNFAKTDLSFAKFATQAFSILSMAEGSANLAKMDGIRFGYQSKKNFETVDEFITNNRNESFSDELKEMILLGNYYLSKERYEQYYEKAYRYKMACMEQFDEVFSDCEIFALPLPALNLEKNSNFMEDYRDASTTCLANFVGLPSLSCSFFGIPFLLLAQKNNEHKLFAAAKQLLKGASYRGI